MEALRAYLKGRRKSDFAEGIGISPSYLSQILSGHRFPSYSMMLKIEKQTSGEVDLRSWAADLPADTEE